MKAVTLPLKQRLVRGMVALGIATALWLPTVHLFFARPAASFYQSSGLSPMARQLAARHLHLWTDPARRQEELRKMRASNAEWDFMGRSFVVWSLANMALREPAAKAEYLSVMDQIIAETTKLEQQEGFMFFLMPYAKVRPYVVKPARSLFVDGEIALMLAARRTVEERSEYRAPLHERIRLMIERMRASPALGAESYPDECWTFDHAVALAAIRLTDQLDHTGQTAFCREWLASARQKLIHLPTGLLVSSFTQQGKADDGPEGSTLWMVAHCLQVIDPPFAEDQYRRARKELGRKLCGFGYAREWPASWQGPMDIDSGPIVPVLGISAGSSGLAFIGAASFGDTDFLTSLAATLDFAAFPARQAGRLRYCASNQVGDAALLYATVLGPLWQTMEPRAKP